MENRMMTKKSILECERKNYEKMKKYQLPYRFKKIGIGIFVVALLSLFFIHGQNEYRLIAKYTMLVGLLIISISKEKIEDELVSNLRMQSYTFAFIAAVLLTITNPIFSFMVNLIFDKQQDNFGGLGDWQILWILLSVQIFCFEYLKKMHKE